MSVLIGFKGRLEDLPVEASLTKNGEKFHMEGAISFQGEPLARLFRLLDAEISEEFVQNYLISSQNPIHGKIRVEVDSTNIALSSELDNLLFAACKKGPSFGLMLGLDESQNHSSEIANALKKLAGLNIASAAIFYRKGTVCPSDLKQGHQVSVPSRLSDYSLIIVGSAAFPDSSVAGSAFKKILGDSFQGFDLAYGLSTKNSGLGALCLLNVPAVGSGHGAFQAKNLYLELLVGDARGLAFNVGGELVVRISENELTFQLSSSLSSNAFLLSAGFSPKAPVVFYRGYRLGEAGVLIGYASGMLQIGFYATIYCNQLQLFGAIIAGVAGEVVNPCLVSAAVSDISIPSLAKNLLSIDTTVFDCLDVIQLNGLEACHCEGLDKAVLADRKNTVELANKINAKLPEQYKISTSEDDLYFAVNESAGKCRYFLTDRKAMRHFELFENGNVHLEAQFYFCDEPAPVDFGSFRAEMGVFLCGRLQVFDMSFEAIFSFRKSTGVFAFARIMGSGPNGCITFGPLSIGPSNDVVDSLVTIPKTNPMASLVELRPKGIVFYLSASKLDASFYLSGRISLFNKWFIDAKILYCSRRILLHTQVRMLGLNVVLAFDADYHDFQSGSFRLKFSIDASELNQLVMDFDQSIREKMQALEHSAQAAGAALADAQARVLSLQSSIEYYNHRIDDCRQEMNDAPWYSTVFVHVAKGAEIIAYEAARAAVYAAIVVANAALEVARIAVKAGAAIGEGVLKLAHQVIVGATQVIFLRHLEFTLEYSKASLIASGSMNLVLLGKERDLSFNGAVDGGDLISLIKGSISKEIDSPAPKRHAPEKLRSIPSLSFQDTLLNISGAQREVERSHDLFVDMQQSYLASFGEEHSVFAHLDASLNQSRAKLMEHVGLTSSSDLKAAMENLHQQIQQSALTEDKDRASEAFSQYNQIHGVLEDLGKSLQKPELRRMRTPLRTSSDPQEYLDMLEENIAQAYQQRPTGDYMNLYFEKAIDNAFANAHDGLAGPTVKRVRRKPAKMIDPDYRQRILVE